MRWTLFSKCLMMFIGLKLDLLGQSNLENFNLYLHTNIGRTLLPTHSRIDLLPPAHTYMSMAIGVLGAYTLANTCGMESGYLLTLQHLADRSICFWQEDSYEYVISYHQMPILFFYKINPVRWPYRHLKLRLGTSFDWIRWGRGMQMRQFRYLGNVISGMSYGVERPSGRIMEFGLSYVHSLKRYEMENKGLVLNSKMDLLSVHFNYYLFKR